MSVVDYYSKSCTSLQTKKETFIEEKGNKVIRWAKIWNYLLVKENNKKRL